MAHAVQQAVFVVQRLIPKIAAGLGRRYKARRAGARLPIFGAPAPPLEPPAR